ncbi:MAG: hypothetical protein HYZ47_04015 [Simkania negevensis]|nr:hypothetical protein [Simkania negevensis]
MYKLLFAISLWMIIGSSYLSTNEHDLESLIETREQSSGQNQKLRCLVSLEELFFDQEGISLDINGVLCPIHSLEKHGKQWIANFDSRRNYCPQGHPNCIYCEQCHRSLCRFYVKPCKKSRE